MKNETKISIIGMLIMLVFLSLIGGIAYLNSDDFRAKNRSKQDYKNKNVLIDDTIKQENWFKEYDFAYKNRQKISENYSEYQSRLSELKFKRPLIKSMDDFNIELNYAEYNIESKKLKLFPFLNFDSNCLGLNLDKFKYADKEMEERYLSGSKERITVRIMDAQLYECKIAEIVKEIAIKNVNDFKKWSWEIIYKYNMSNMYPDAFYSLNEVKDYTNTGVAYKIHELNIPIHIKTIRLMDGEKVIVEINEKDLKLK